MSVDSLRIEEDFLPDDGPHAPAAAPRKKRRPKQPAETPFATFLRQINEVPLLRPEEEKAFARLKMTGDAIFYEQIGILAEHVLQALEPESPDFDAVTAAFDRLKRHILQREEVMQGLPASAAHGPPTAREVTVQAQKALHRMMEKVRERRKNIEKSFDPVIDPSTDGDDRSLARDVIYIQQKLATLEDRICTSEAPEIGALAGIGREAFHDLRSAFPQDHPCTQALAHNDTQFREAVAKEPLGSAYLQPLLAGRIIDDIHPRMPTEVLMRANLRLVVDIARSYKGKGIGFYDLVEEGMLGLRRGIDGYQLKYNTKISTYVSYWIKQSMKRAIVNHARNIQVPAYMQEMIIKFRTAKTKLLNELGRPSTNEEIMKRAGIPAKKLKILTGGLTVMEAEMQGGNVERDGKIPSLEEMVVDDDNDSLDEMEERDDVDLLLALLQKLDPRSREIVERRHPLNGAEPETLKEVGESLGLTRERVRQIESDGLGILQEEAGSDAESDDAPKRPPSSHDLQWMAKFGEKQNATASIQIASLDCLFAVGADAVVFLEKLALEPAEERLKSTQAFAAEKKLLIHPTSIAYIAGHPHYLRQRLLSGTLPKANAHAPAPVPAPLPSPRPPVAAAKPVRRPVYKVVPDSPPPAPPLAPAALAPAEDVSVKLSLPAQDEIKRRQIISILRQLEQKPQAMDKWLQLLLWQAGITLNKEHQEYLLQNRSELIRIFSS